MLDSSVHGSERSKAEEEAVIDRVCRGGVQRPSDVLQDLPDAKPRSGGEAGGRSVLTDLERRTRRLGVGAEAAHPAEGGRGAGGEAGGTMMAVTAAGDKSNSVFKKS